jgi:hypothetical protein
MTAPTFCDACDHVDPQTRKHPPHRWTCLRHPRLEGAGFVVRGQWVDAPPHLYCKDTNGGLCPLYEPRREAPDDVQS